MLDRLQHEYFHALPLLSPSSPRTTSKLTNTEIVSFMEVMEKNVEGNNYAASSAASRKIFSIWGLHPAQPLSAIP